jgi:glutathione synthase/RimK-type ligase-like ATP-grasp enzyme
LSLYKQINTQDWDEVVLKPAIAAAGRHTYRFKKKDAEQYETIYQQLIRSESMLIQAFQKSVPTRGEIALIYFGGIYSHAVLKRAKPGDFRVQDDFGGTVHSYEPTKDELDLGNRAIAACSSTPIYARVDIIEENRGKPALTELELIEPELWLRNNPDAADRFASAIAAYVSSFTL